MEESDKHIIENMISELKNLEFKYHEELGIPDRCRDARYELEKIE